MIFSFAPMEGVTGAIFRRTHRRLFPEADRYYAPFLAPDRTGAVKESRFRDVLPELNQGLTLIPQILANDPESFLALAERLASLGCREVNLNCGCPSGTVVAKRKGAGLLADPRALDAFLSAIFERSSVGISVKTRLGVESADEFPALLEVYRRYPLRELTVHVRTREGFYRSAPDPDAFAVLEDSPFPVCYNGGVFDANDCRRLRERFPWLRHLMLGRGAAMNPALFRVLRGGKPLEREELRLFYETLLDETLASGLAQGFALDRMKELWSYGLRLFPDSEKLAKGIRKARRTEDYREAVHRLFAEANFDPNARFE
ncbi:MAG: tRNA-dihydrouridine synthase family protein [Oscillospiraceae bacterium]|nr:tRNA-dihydrouridine synthase family protein [Oscillospiraceae bacterium]